MEKLSNSIKAKQENLKNELEEEERKITTLIISACESKIKEFDKNTKAFAKEENKNEEVKEESSYHVFADDTYHPMHYTLEASTKTLYKRLARYIKLVDYMMVQLKLSIIKNSFDLVIFNNNKQLVAIKITGKNYNWKKRKFNF